MKTIRHLLARAVCMLLLASVFSFNSFSQTQDIFSQYSNMQPSVNTYAMTQYGNLTPSLYTGAMVYSLPLFTYKDNDFSIPASLEYHYDGYRPSMSAGEIGLGWSMLLGGTVTRTVHGVPDELYNAAGTSGYLEYLTIGQNYDSSMTVRNSSYERLYSGIENINSIIENGNIYMLERTLTPFSDMPAYFVPNGPCNHYETTPDEYHFSVMGIDGYFTLLPDGSVKVYNSTLPYGEIGASISIVRTGAHNTLSITLTTGDGYEYLFGGSVAATEYSESVSDVSGYIIDSDIDDNLTAVSFKLSRIKAPNGRTAVFNYSTNSYSQITGSELRKSRITSLTYNGPGQSSSSPFGQGYRAAQMQHYSVLESVTIDGHAVISLSYSTKQYDDSDQEYFDNQSVLDLFYSSFYVSPQVRLAGVTLRNHSNEIVEQATLSHHYSINGTPKMFLDSVSCLSSGVTSFTYNSPNYLPKNDTNNTDWWGWWNSDYFSWSYYKTSGISLYSQFVNDGFKRPNYQRTLTGSLSCITFPTGGTCSIEYEQNTVSKRIYYEFGIEPYLANSPSSFSVGGIRVRSIVENDGISQRTTTFSYDKEDGSSSGMLLQMPLLAVGTTLTYSNYMHTAICNFVSFSSGDMASLPSENTVTYSHVQKHLPDGSREEYVFHSYEDYPDLYLNNYNASFLEKKVSGDSDYYTYGNGYSNNNNFVIGICAPIVRNLSCMRGKLESELFYSADNTLKLRKDHYYGVTEVSQTGMSWYNNITNFTGTTSYLLQPQILYDTVYEYLEDGSYVSTTSSINYNSLGQTIKSSTSHSNSTEVNNRYLKYLHETNGSALPSIVSHAIWSKVVNGQEYVAARERYVYSNPTRHVKPSDVIVYGDNGNVLNVSNMFTVPSGIQSQVIKYTYDTQYRLQSATGPGGSTARYTWDRGNLTSMSYGNTSNVQNFQWKDLVGITYKQSPSGQSESYNYDGNNRLLRVLDSNGNKVTEYRYNLIND